MAALSDNKYDVFEWIKKVMYSCKDNPQLQSSLTLPTIFLNKYDDYILYSKLFSLENNIPIFIPVF